MPGLVRLRAPCPSRSSSSVRRSSPRGRRAAALHRRARVRGDRGSASRRRRRRRRDVGGDRRGVHLLNLPVRPDAIAELQAASAMGQGRLYRTYDDLMREQGIATAQILLTFFDMSARTHYLNARRTLRTLLDWRVVPVINENDTTTTDEISFGDNDFLAAQVAILARRGAARAADRHRRPLHREPAGRPDAHGSSRRSTDFEPSWPICRSATRCRRSARAGCGARSSRRRWRLRRASRR